MSNRSIFTYDMNPSDINKKIDELKIQLDKMNFKPFTIEDEECFVYIASRLEQNLGTLHQFLKLEHTENKIIITAWMYKYTFDLKLTHYTLSTELDSSKEISLDGLLLKVPKNKFKKKIKSLEEIILSK